MSCLCPDCLNGSNPQSYFMPAPPTSFGTVPYAYAQPPFAYPAMNYLPPLQCQDSCCAPQVVDIGSEIPGMTYMPFSGTRGGCGDPWCSLPGCGTGGKPQIDIDIDIGGGATGAMCNDPFCPDRNCGGAFVMPYSSTSSYRRAVKTSSLPKFESSNLGSTSGWKNINLGGGRSKVRWEKPTGRTYDSYGSGCDMM